LKIPLNVNWGNHSYEILEGPRMLRPHVLGKKHRGRMSADQAATLARGGKRGGKRRGVLPECPASKTFSGQAT